VVKEERPAGAGGGNGQVLRRTGHCAHGKNRRRELALSVVEGAPAPNIREF
jgi:hypothetical protein